MHQDLILRFKAIALPERAIISQRFFKTAPGEYGEGDIFLGISMPIIREEIKAFKTMPLPEIQFLLDSPLHEVRMAAVLLLNEKMKVKSTEQQVFEFYLQNAARINNWDLVDSSAHLVVGKYLFEKDRSILFDLAMTDHLWSQRIAMVATWYFIRKHDVQTVIDLAEVFIHHKHDLMHKATGWMLREAHKRVPTPIEGFLETHKGILPRTMLRYAIEKFPQAKKDYFMGRS